MKSSKKTVNKAKTLKRKTVPKTGASKVKSLLKQNIDNAFLRRLRQ